MKLQPYGENHPLPEDQPESSGSKDVCIFKVLNATRENDKELYTPMTIGLGPWHGSRFAERESLKKNYRESFLKKINRTFVDVQKKIQRIRQDVENCYEGPSVLTEDEFIERMGTDTCFLLEFLLKIFNDDASAKPYESLFMYDLVLVENQLLMMLLEEIYSLAGTATLPTLSQLVFKYFSGFNSKGILHEGIHAKHFVDLLRSLMLSSRNGSRYQKADHVVDQLFNVSELCYKGVVLKVGRGMSLLDVGFQGRVLTLPQFRVDDVREACFRNVLRFEGHYYPDSPYVTDYFYMLSCLLRLSKMYSPSVEIKLWLVRRKMQAK